MSALPATKATHAELRSLLRHREVGAALLRGDGLEIGAFHYPLALPTDARVEFLDVEDVTQLRERFPELHDDAIVAPRWLGDIVTSSIRAITSRRFDFVVMNHVLEHVANPIQAIANVWDGLVEDGLLVLSVPDKRFTFDRARPLTTFAHLLDDYRTAVSTVSEDHYVEFLESAAPEVFADGIAVRAALHQAHRRREHAHVWDSDSFRAFWNACVGELDLDAHLLYQSTAATNRFEYFAVIRKTRSRMPREEDAMRLLRGIHRTRPDLQQAFPVGAATHDRDLLTWATTAGATVDSEAPALVAYQDHYRRLLGNSGNHWPCPAQR